MTDIIELTGQWQVLDAEPQYGGTFAFITSNYYSVDGAIRGWAGYDGKKLDDSNPERFSVENMTEFLICTDSDDLGGTEIWSDYDYVDDLMPMYMTEDYADSYARQQALRELSMPFDAVYGWDGGMGR